MKKELQKEIDEVLLKNGFKYYNDWEYGPMCSLPSLWDHITFKLMAHDTAYWIIFHRHASGENKRMNLGSSKNAQDIIALRDLLGKTSGYGRREG